MKDTGIILLNLGGPDTLQAVRPFLYNLFSDREIIRLGPEFMQRPLARLISTTRARHTRSLYKRIGGGSPILNITRAQARALKRETGLNVYIGMRYWHPFTSDTLEQVNRDGITKLLAISLYPHYSKATTGSSIRDFKRHMLEYPIEYSAIESWFSNKLYIDALVDVIGKGIDRFHGEDVVILYSAHSLPQSFIDEGDPYVKEIEGTIKIISERIPNRRELSFQSRSGPVKWLEPSTDQMLKSLAEEGVKNVLVVPISFVSDHIETLYEIDILYKGMAQGLGMRLERTESLNTHPIFIECLKGLALSTLREKGWL